MVTCRTKVSTCSTLHAVAYKATLEVWQRVGTHPAHSGRTERPERIRFRQDGRIIRLSAYPSENSYF